MSYAQWELAYESIGKLKRDFDVIVSGIVGRYELTAEERDCLKSALYETVKDMKGECP